MDDDMIGNTFASVPLCEISVVVCTYNRSNSLRETLESFAAMRGAGDESVEILVVDNNSTDDTRKTTERHAGTHRNTRYVLAPQPGLSNARNVGMREAHGRFVAYVDDDVTFDVGWLDGVREAFARHPDAACLGGQSIPRFEGGCPDWMSDELLRNYGSTRSGSVEKWMEYPEYPFGLNMAFRRDVFPMVGDFTPNLGRKKTNLLSMEESDYFLRVARCGLRVIYSPTALLYHRIPPERTSKEWILWRQYWQGVSEIAFRQMHDPVSRRTMLNEIRQTAKQTVQMIVGKNFTPRRVYWHVKNLKFSHHLGVAWSLGRLRRLCSELVTP